MLLLQLPKKDLNARENMDEIEFIPILEKINPTEAEKFISETMRFLYEQEREFGEVSEELKVLRKLHKRVKLLIVQNLKQVNFHYFNINDTIE
ncbi:8179_t:CDS:2 [Funneliformis mosseae]|uniref:8179_t:CDS:1 n=1 Tax=Funneliformis mosseae TaxID=27381 RepID=A0A9N9CWJ6_FUNMO|nr:8179_t:CDS:2 [Funneliformis mosseae]